MSLSFHDEPMENEWEMLKYASFEGDHDLKIVFTFATDSKSRTHVKCARDVGYMHRAP